MNKKKAALLIVLVLLVLAVIWSFMATPRYKTVAPGTTPTRKTATVARVSSVKKAPSPAPGAAASKTSGAYDERILRLDLLEREQSGFKGYRRNIFKPVFADEIKMMKQKAAAFKPLPIPPVAVVAKPVPVVQPEIKPVDPMEALKSTLSQFKYLGFLKKDNRKTIFLLKDKEILLVRKGERFAKKYEATAITEQALTIRANDTGEEIVIPLTENKSLAANLK
jgi:hypothetical protein